MFTGANKPSITPQGLPAAHPAETNLQTASQTAGEQLEPKEKAAADPEQPAQQVRTSSKAIELSSQAATSATAAAPDTSARGPLQDHAAQRDRGQLAELPSTPPGPSRSPLTLAPQSPAHAYTFRALLQEPLSPASQRQCQPKGSTSSGERMPPLQFPMPQPHSPAENGIAAQQAATNPAPRTPSNLADGQAKPPVSMAKTPNLVLGPTLELELPVLEAARVDTPGVAAVAESPALVAAPAAEAGSAACHPPGDADKVQDAFHSVSDHVLSWLTSMDHTYI